MITMVKNPLAPLFSSISRNPEKPKISPVVELLPAGKIIYGCLAQLHADYPTLRILRWIAMPDHIHFEVFVTERTEMPLGSMIAAFKAACTKKYQQEFPESRLAKENLPLFEPGFNDKIAFRAGAKDAFYNYIADNPRRYLIKKLCPEYFFHKLMIEINGTLCGIYGNLFLLDNPIMSESAAYPSVPLNLKPEKKEWEETIRSGGVLVSPFINPAEKEYRNAAIQNGNGIILIADYRFSDRKKPYKELFDQCAEGKLLIISTEQFAEPPRKMEYLHARELNAIAAAIAQLSPCSAIIRPRQ